MHFFTLVIPVPGDGSLKERIEASLAPFDDDVEAPPHECGLHDLDDCTCSQRAAFDWYQIGGRFDRWITGELPAREESSPAAATERDALERNCITVGRYLALLDQNAVALPYAVCAPDEVWLRDADPDGEAFDRAADDPWLIEVRKTLAAFPPNTPCVGVDCHGG